MILLAMAGCALKGAELTRNVTIVSPDLRLEADDGTFSWKAGRRYPVPFQVDCDRSVPRYVAEEDWPDGLRAGKKVSLTSGRYGHLYGILVLCRMYDDPPGLLSTGRISVGDRQVYRIGIPDYMWAILGNDEVVTVSERADYNEIAPWDWEFHGGTHLAWGLWLSRKPFGDPKGDDGGPTHDDNRSGSSRGSGRSARARKTKQRPIQHTGPR